MKKNKPAKYFAIRIFLFPLMLYFFLVLPIQGIMLIKSAPDFIQKYKNKDTSESSVKIATDTVTIGIGNSGIDTNALHKAHNELQKKHGVYFNLNDNKDEADVGFGFSNDDTNDSHKGYELGGLVIWVIVAGLIIGITFNFPFRRYFKRKRRNKPVSEKLTRYCRRYLQYTPYVNSGIYALGFLIVDIFSVYLLHSNCNADPLEHKLFKNMIFISVISSVLTVLFVYLWQKHRVQFKYLEVVYTKDELQKNIYKTGQSHSIRLRLWLITIVTTILPLTIVIYYFILSISTVKDLGLTSFSDDQARVLLGKFYGLIERGNSTPTLSDYENYFFVSSVDVILTFAGIATSVISAGIYIVFLVNWTSKSITIPVKDLVNNMKKAGNADMSNFSLVRTNDEIGMLAEGFNDMTVKIRGYIDEISSMNRDLEQKVKDRTAEVVQQKEEIEAQRDQILEKNEELLQQHEEIISQKDVIEDQKKIVEDKNKNITDSIRYALRIQRAILPSDEFIQSVLPDSFILYKPKDIVSGDFYWIKEVYDEPETKKLFIAAVDCTGHGVPGALMSIVGNNLLNLAIKENHITKPSEILDYVSHEIKATFRSQMGESSVNDGMDLTLCVFDKEAGVLEFAGVHNPLYLIRNKSLIVYKTDNRSLGELHSDGFKGYTNHKIKLEKGDIFYLFSDGYVDQFGGKDRRKYLSKNFRDTLTEIHTLQMIEQKEMLYRIFDYWRGENEQTDDILVIGIKV